MVAFSAYDLFLCALIMVKGMRSYRYGLERSLLAIVIRHGIHRNGTASNLLTPGSGTLCCTILQSER
jgi:hypothetical protein